MTQILWVRRDLRIAQHAALAAAAARGPVLPVFVRDPNFAGVSERRRDRLEASLSEFAQASDGALVVRRGDPVEVLAQLARETDACDVHFSEEFTPFGRARDERVRTELRQLGVETHVAGTAYAIRPGTLRTAAGTPYRVFTPFLRAWRESVMPAAESGPVHVEWSRAAHGDKLDARAAARGGALGPCGETGARSRWQRFLDGDALSQYAERRDRPDLEGTSQMSAHLKFGEIHPLTMLADIAAHPAGGSPGAQSFVAELAWREFYADVLLASPGSAWSDWRDDLSSLEYDDPAEELLESWRRGQTGFPFVDAGMRQLLATGWMHNRLRMITASFLVKDLHIWWPHGARHFLRHLIDSDLASNNHGWQWVAGTGTDAAPYFRIFNPITQGKRFDPDGPFVRRWIPELAHIDGSAVHEPWRLLAGAAADYPEPVVDHAMERRIALARYEEARKVPPS